ncbi:MAG TPA: hypothetical protein ENO12_00020 [Thermoplasmatales archaeon]|nr:hypothetical protein [Thermoplasmatales archaeon]
MHFEKTGDGFDTEIHASKGIHYDKKTDKDKGESNGRFDDLGSSSKGTRLLAYGWAEYAGAVFSP